MDIKKIIMSDRDIKENSVNAYVISLKKLNDNKDITSVEFLKETNKIQKKLDELALTTRKNRLTAILVFLRAVGGHEKLIEHYGELLSKYTDEYFSIVSKNEKSEKEEKNWATLKELNKVMKDYEKEIKERGIKQKNKLTPKERVLLQNYLVTSLYLLIPPRRLDYNVKVVKKRSEIKDGDNYLLNETKTKKKFIIQDFKTVKSHGVQEFDVPKKLNSVINLSRQFNNSEFLLVNNRGGRLSDNGLGKLIKKAFAPTKKEITLNLLRKITISENVDMEAVKKSKKLAEEMNHSVKMQQTVYFKD